ncbi:polysaccharide deacetylase family protein [Clostridium magnum]|uniref:Peptidoglycan-N-acetylglucosamine deacetylase n=1 Tax=Clostridium magnum DSM 2767 TaxID=1121326 RepID=A0A162QBZ9_9CLOT|nr:polysaccharide deacetylase family protein [Clostridium magnum]KZL88365.1 peptidoglycan-N-acetylglucosamine deacetylase [Clostridium magnum DSM 2767]SHI30974.1 Peptidoglycan/xylan/chitin deacetylase, PgdA/CDA1 family [Clostridium magnum DSM 2767]
MLKKGYLFILGWLILTLVFISNEVFADKIQKKFWGSGRHAVDTNMSQDNWGKPSSAVLVSGGDFEDAFSAVPLAKKFNAPIILVNRKVLDSYVKDKLIRSNIKKVFIVGVTGGISEDLEGYIDGTNIRYQRILRSDIQESNLKIAQFIVKNSSIKVASREDSLNELSFQPTDVVKEIPILLVNNQGLSEGFTKNMYNSEGVSSEYRYRRSMKKVNEFQSNVEFRSIYVTIGSGLTDKLNRETSTAKTNYTDTLINSNMFLLKTPFGSKVSLINNLTNLRKEDAVPEVTVQTLLSNKKTDEDRSYDAEKVSKILDNNFESDGRKIAFLTFDDGPSTTVTPKILDILKNNDIKATFFLIGSSIQADEESKSLVVRILQEGHAIGNHTYTHNLKAIYPGNKVNPERYMEEVKETNDAISNAIGQEFKTRITRMPGGCMSRKYYNDPNLNTFNTVLRENNMYSIDWNAYDGDSDGRRKSAEELLKEVKNTVGNQEKVVLLMHDTYGKEETARALPKIIEYLRSQRYEFRKIK